MQDMKDILLLKCMIDSKSNKIVKASLEVEVEVEGLAEEAQYLEDFQRILESTKRWPILAKTSSMLS